MIKSDYRAREKKGMKVTTLTRKDGGKMAGTADIEIRVPHRYADRIQEIHIKSNSYFDSVDRKRDG